MVHVKTIEMFLFWPFGVSHLDLRHHAIVACLPNKRQLWLCGLFSEVGGRPRAFKRIQMLQTIRNIWWIRTAHISWKYRWHFNAKKKVAAKSTANKIIALIENSCNWELIKWDRCLLFCVLKSCLEKCLCRAPILRFYQRSNFERRRNWWKSDLSRRQPVRGKFVNFSFQF